jgi:putative flippase GtrA
MSETTPQGTSFLAAHVIFVRYVFFAALSGLANLASQEIAIRALPLAPLMFSVLVGTGVGFLTKYVMEKRWVFLDPYESHTAELRKIIIYGLSGVGTTLLFWAIELGAWHLWGTLEAKYAGAALGLALGNWVKYILDKHWVFGRKL